MTDRNPKTPQNDLDLLLSALQQQSERQESELLDNTDFELALSLSQLAETITPPKEFSDSMKDYFQSTKPRGSLYQSTFMRIASVAAIFICVLMIGSVWILTANRDEDRDNGNITVQVANSTEATQIVILPTSTPDANPTLLPPTQTLEASGTSTALPSHTPTTTPLPSDTALPTQTAIGTMIAQATQAPNMMVTTTQSADSIPTILPTITIDPQFQSDLEAGEINDNEEFAAYLAYRLGYQRYGDTVNIINVDIVHRHIITVTDENNLPILGAEVSVYTDDQRLVAQLRTTATGEALFFPRAYPTYADESQFVVQVSKDAAIQSFLLTRRETDAEWRVILPISTEAELVKLDILFLVDSTGSMSDEIEELTLNMLNIADQIDKLPANPQVRYGLVTYRDRGDSYVTETTNFIGDVGQFQTTLSLLTAGGGGDYPESVSEGLHQAVNNVSWGDHDTVKIIILVGDAPPQLYPAGLRYDDGMIEASNKGIKIFTIASSGMDDRGEYVFRQIAQFTGGNFIFLTYEETPQSASSNEPATSGTDHNILETQFTVEYLDSLVVRLIEEELAALQTPIE